jgi:uncharacterized protein YijF (DUF1287 family)
MITQTDIIHLLDLHQMILVSAQIDFRAVFQADVKRNPPLYDEDLDPNINYRRVKRLQVYFSRNAKILTNDMIL